MGLNFSENELIHVGFISELKQFYSVMCIFGKIWLDIVLHDFNLTYYSSIILGSFSILLFPKLCWHIGLTPSAIPDFGAPKTYKLSENCGDEFRQLIEEYNDLFCTTPGKTTHDCHYIPTKGPPIRVPPRRIPGHYRDEVIRQLELMLSQGVIKESSSPWMAPTVFVPKKSGELRICVDYRALNKQSVKDSYPLPLPDEIQDRLTNATVFSTLDLHSGYWQLPVAEEDQPKTAFCPGPGMGLYQFCRMPFGLSGAPGSFQRLMDSVLRGLPFASTYLDDILVYSPNVESHKDHLHQVFLCLQKAGLTLRGRKCYIGVPKVCYLGHIFSASGIQPDPNKVHAV